jgi:hypothetical protein
MAIQGNRQNESFLDACARIHRDWHACAKARDTEGLLALYAADARLESPLVPALLDGRTSGVLSGHDELRAFFALGASSRPIELVRWHRSGRWLTDGERVLMWEYPRETPEGDQVEIVEIMEIEGGLIQRHRIYWGWRGTGLLVASAVRKATGRTS